MRFLPILFAASLALASCSHGDGGNNSSGGASGTQAEAAPENLMADPQNGMVPVTEPSPQPAATMPAAFRGRWAAVASDCTAGGAGLLVVDDQGLAVGGKRLVVQALATIGDDALTASVAKPGGGQQSERLTLIDGGKALMRQQQAPAAAVPYQRCPA